MRRLTRAGHTCVVFDRDPHAVTAVGGGGVVGADSLPALAGALSAPRVVWVMLPAGSPTDLVIGELAGILADGDIVVDGGNTYYRDDPRHAGLLAPRGIRLVDCGTSGGIRGLADGFCLMLGGTVGAQFGASAGQYLRGEQLRFLLALLVLAVAVRFGATLVLAPTDPFSLAVLGPGGIL